RNSSSILPNSLLQGIQLGICHLDYLGRRLLSLTFLSQQSFGYCPCAKRSHSNTRAGVVRDLFETAHKAIAPMWQPGAYIRSCELSSVVERTDSNLARKTKGWSAVHRQGANISCGECLK